MRDNLLGWAVAVIIVIIIIICLVWWASSRNSFNKGNDRKKRQQHRKNRENTRHTRDFDHESRGAGRSAAKNYTEANQNGNTRFETSCSFQLNQDGKYRIKLPKSSRPDQSYTVATTFDFSEHKISTQTPTSTPDGKMTEGYVTEIRHHIFKDSLLYNAQNSPPIQPAEINRKTRSGSTKLSIGNSSDGRNDLIAYFEISPGVAAVGSMTIRLNSQTPARQHADGFAIMKMS